MRKTPVECLCSESSQATIVASIQTDYGQMMSRSGPTVSLWSTRKIISAYEKVSDASVNSSELFGRFLGM